MKSILSPSHNFSILNVILSINTSSNWPSERILKIDMFIHIKYTENNPFTYHAFLQKV